MRPLHLSRVSRRAVLAAVASSLMSGLARGRLGFTVAMVRPPRWIGEAHEIMRTIQTPRIPKRIITLQPVDGDARPLIQQAFDDLGQRGGGKVILSPGTWRSNGPIQLRSGTELHLTHDTSLVFSGDREHYLPVVHTRWEGTELYGYCPFIYAYKVHDIAITGSGTLAVDRQGDMESWRKEQTEAQKRLRSMGTTGVPLGQRVFAEGSFLRPSLMQFFGCERVLIENIAIGEIPFWGVHLVYTAHATVRGISVRSDRVNNDGIDIDSSRRILVENCTFNTGDDCIAVKSGRDLDGRSIAQPSEDIVIRDCQMIYGGSAGLAIGSEMSGGVRRVYIVRCEFGKVDTIVNIKANLDRGGAVEHIRAWNLRARECDNALQITTAYHGYMGGKFPPRFEDIEIDELTCEKANQAVVIRGDRQSVIRRVALRDVQIKQARVASDIRHAEVVACERVVVGEQQLADTCASVASGL